jgi:thiamine biosynthesis lipoprotein
MKKMLSIISILLISLSLTGCNHNDELIKSNRNWSAYLHTIVTLEVYYNENELINEDNVFKEVEDIISFYHKISDKYDTYEGYINIKTINDNPTATHVVSPELFELISFTLKQQDNVDNLFNLALGPVLQIWHDYREDCLLNSICAVPEMNNLVEASLFIDPKDIIMDNENYTITMSEGMSIDLGGVSKGFLSGKIIEYLDSLNLNGYLLNNGESNVSVGGTHPTREGGKFLIGIADPTFSLPYYATVYLASGDQISTSGDYQQYYKIGDEVYHHIINNDTLMPERNSRSVSIIYSDPAIADLYSTAIFLMTIEEGIKFVDGVNGLEGIWYAMDGTIHFSQNFEELYLQDIYE